MPSAQRPLGRTLGLALHAARSRAGLTRAEVARRVGVPPAEYGRFERGALYPSIPTLRRLCVVLAIPSDDLLGLGARQPSALRRLVSAARGLTVAQLRMLHVLVQSLPPPPRG